VLDLFECFLCHGNIFPLIFQILKHKISLLEASNAELKHELKRRQLTSENVAQRALETQVFF